MENYFWIKNWKIIWNHGKTYIFWKKIIIKISKCCHGWHHWLFWSERQAKKWVNVIWFMRCGEKLNKLFFYQIWFVFKDGDSMGVGQNDAIGILCFYCLYYKLYSFIICFSIFLFTVNFDVAWQWQFVNAVY